MAFLYRRFFFIDAEDPNYLYDPPGQKRHSGKYVEQENRIPGRQTFSGGQHYNQTMRKKILVPMNVIGRTGSNTIAIRGPTGAHLKKQGDNLYHGLCRDKEEANEL